MQIHVMSDEECRAMDESDHAYAQKLDAQIDKLIAGITKNSLQLAVKLHDMEHNSKYRKLGFQRFDEYVNSKRDVAQRAMSQQRISELKLAGYVLTTIKERCDTGISGMPTNVGQCTPLAKLNQAQIPKVWNAVVEKSQQEDKPITAAMVSATVRKMYPATKKERKPKTKKPSRELASIRKMLDEMSETELRKLFIEIQGRLG